MREQIVNQELVRFMRVVKYCMEKFWNIQCFFRGLECIMVIQQQSQFDKKEKMQSIEHKISAFLLTLRQMIENQNQSSIGWFNGGRDFIIRDPSRFSEQTLPRYFRHSNLSSFIRQLNIYHFKKLSNQKDPNQYVYHHNYFSQDQPQKMALIQRKHKGNPHLKPANDSSDNLIDDYCENPNHNSSGNISYESHRNSNQIPIEEEYNQQVLERKKQRKSETIDTYQRKKALDKEIYELEQYLNYLSQSTLRLSKEKNNLQKQADETIQSHCVIKQALSQYLIKSYQQQYRRYSSIIQLQFKEQQGMFRELWTKGLDETHSMIIPGDSREGLNIQGDHSKRKSMQIYKGEQKERIIKNDYSCYNSTSSGGDGPRKTTSHSDPYNILYIKHIPITNYNHYPSGIIDQPRNQIIMSKSQNRIIINQSSNGIRVNLSQNAMIINQDVNKNQNIDLPPINNDNHNSSINKSINNHERPYETEEIDSDQGNNLLSKSNKKGDQQHKQKNHNKSKQQNETQTRWRRVFKRKDQKDDYHGQRDAHGNYGGDYYGEGQCKGNKGRSIIISYSPQRGFSNESVVQLGRRQQKTNFQQQIQFRPRTQCQIVQIKTDNILHNDDSLYHLANKNG